MFWLITFVRNLLYDLKIMKSYSFLNIPIISIGNLTVGGTGKTPHIEYFVRENLALGKRVAVVSRGYKRKSKGMVVATEMASAKTIGDEPYQIFCKFPQIIVIATKDRVNAIQYLLSQQQRPDVILLDDAFQYRRLHPSRHILLIDYNRPIFNDRIMPYGRLRESLNGIKRADEVIITKCPETLSADEKQVWAKKLNLPNHIVLKFSTLLFFTPKNIFSREPLDISQKYHIQTITGVVNADSLYRYLHPFSLSLTKKEYPDHHNFTKQNIESINILANSKDIIIVTEKDAARLIDNPFLSDSVKAKIYSVEVRVSFL
ncbi:MAG: tetraacyldisaccharide 4'-kinase [Bacteroidales bacterium]|nr:MAG: tetraacyldisaccharide 4'-kinase [Bacteroidales bacterium]